MGTPKSPCPICKKDARTRAENESFPFCSERCRKIDLGNWLEERYRVPAEEASEEEPPGDEGEPS